MGDRQPKRIVVAQIAGAFGVKGEVRVRSFTAEPEACFRYGPLSDEMGEVLLTPISHRPLNDGFGVRAKELRQREDWEAMKGALLHVERKKLPAVEDDEIYIEDLIGRAIVHVDGRLLGKVVAAHNFGAGDLIEVRPASGASYFLPFTKKVFPKTDPAENLLAEPEEDLLPESLQRQSGEGGTN